MKHMTVIIDGTEYLTRPEISACAGCVGHNDDALCERLPHGCDDDSVIWVEKLGTPTTDEQTDDFQGSALIKQAVMA